jgi:hypothetical protein
MRRSEVLQVEVEDEMNPKDIWFVCFNAKYFALARD